jgi:NADPH-dependent 2,4-dienoyl-CoA reductase/sulfur reductase-like enzyme
MTQTEVLVVGGGAAGMSAAATAARHGCKVLLLDDNASPGGQIWRDSVQSSAVERQPGKEAALKLLHASGADLWMGWRVFDAPQRGVLRAACGNKAETFHYRRLVIATGARERFLPFPGWTLPGVFGAGGLQALVKGGFPVTGKRVVVAGTGPLLLAVAAHLRQYGAQVVSVVEQAPFARLFWFVLCLLFHPAKIVEGLRYRAVLRRVPYRTSCWPVAALGRDRLTGVTLTDSNKTWNEPCDLLACGFHLVPNTEIAALLGCTFHGDFVAVDELQQTSIESVYCAGEPAGIAGLDGALLQGEIAGLACAGRPGQARALRKRRNAAQSFARRLDAAFRLREDLRSLAAADSIVCRCEDVTFDQLASHSSWTDAKLQTRCGMGPCQGRICGPATQTLFGWKAGSVRPPLYPVPLSALCHQDSLIPTAFKETQ